MECSIYFNEILSNLDYYSLSCLWFLWSANSESALNDEPEELLGICRYELLPPHLGFEGEKLLRLQKTWSMEVCWYSGALPMTLYFFFQAKTEKEKFIWYSFQVRGMVWVEERKGRSHSESFESPWLQDRVVPVSPCYYLLSALNRSVGASISMTSTSIAQSQQWSADFYLQKSSCCNKSRVL